MDGDELARQARRMLDRTTADLEASWAMDDAEREQRIATFHRSAVEFCDFIDGIEEGKHPRLYEDLLRLLTQLAATGLALPPRGDCGEADYNEMSLSSEARQRVSRAIGNATASAVDELTADAEEDDPEAQRAFMLWDDLADIYIELKNGLVIFALGADDPKAEAAWQWRFGYESHWAEHLFSALLTIHEIRFRLMKD